MKLTSEIFNFDIRSHFTQEELSVMGNLISKFDGMRGLLLYEPKLYKRFKKYKEDYQKFKDLVF